MPSTKTPAGQRRRAGAPKPPRTASGPPPPPKRANPQQLRLPPDLLAEIKRDVVRRGTSFNAWIEEAARRRLHPPREPTRRARAECEHPNAALLSKPGGKQTCRLCGETVTP